MWVTSSFFCEGYDGKGIWRKIFVVGVFLLTLTVRASGLKDRTGLHSASWGLIKSWESRMADCSDASLPGLSWTKDRKTILFCCPRDPINKPLEVFLKIHCRSIWPCIILCITWYLFSNFQLNVVTAKCYCLPTLLHICSYKYSVQADSNFSFWIFLYCGFCDVIPTVRHDIMNSADLGMGALLLGIIWPVLYR